LYDVGEATVSASPVRFLVIQYLEGGRTVCPRSRSTYCCRSL
jgi:hypothetical protein